MNEQRRIIDAEYISADDQLDGDTAAEFASFIDDMNATENADAWITVMRIPTDARGAPLPNSKHIGQLFNEPLGTSSVNDVIERIRREYIRPGENSITVRVIGKQQGMKGLKFNRIYTIERANKAETAEGGRESLAEIMRIMADNQRATDERIERLLAARATVGPAPDPLQQVATLLTAMAPIMAAVAGRPPAPVTNGAADMLATLKVMKEASSMFGGNGGGDDDGNSTMKTVRAVAEAVAPGLKFLANKSETERMTVAERLRRLPPPAPAAIAPPKPATAKAPPPVRPNPTPPPNKAAPANNNTGTNVPEGEDVNLKDLREKLEIVATMCDEGQTPEAVAELIVDNIEDEQLEELYRRVEPENAVAQFAILAPKAVRGREQFFEKMRLAILAQYEDDPDAVDTGTGNEGDDGLRGDLGDDPVDVNSIPDLSH